jgi:hypothetical protein
MSALSNRLAGDADRLGGLLDVEQAQAAAAILTQRSTDGPAAQLRDLDPGDETAVPRAVAAVSAFQSAVLDVASLFSTGMGFGEAALGGLDLDAATLALELSRLLLESADLAAAAEFAATLRGALAPVLDTPLPDPTALAGGAVDVGLTGIGRLTGVVQGFDATAVGTSVRSVLTDVMAPLTALTQALESVGTEVGSAIRSVRGIVDEVDLRPVADAVRRAVQPVVDALEVVEQGVSAVESTLRDVATAITTALAPVSEVVSAARQTVAAALGTARGALEALHLQDLADRLAAALQAVAQALAAAALSPYFDSAIDVIDTATGVVDAVPFSLLPTDVQQEVVDVCKPIKSLDLQAVEDELRAELGEVRDGMQVDALDVIESAYRDVVSFLAELDPGPRLVALEADDGPLARLKAALDEVDPQALLAPVADALTGFRGLLGVVDLDALVIDPLTQAFAPVRSLLDEIDPAPMLAPVQAQLEEARTSITGLLHLDDAESMLTSARDGIVDVLGKLDLTGLSEVLDDVVGQRLRRPSPGAPLDVLTGLVAALAQATGLDADDAGVEEAIAWVGGIDGAAVVRSRLAAVVDSLSATRDSVRALDPAPLVSAAQAQRRAMGAALEVHAADGDLRLAVDSLLAGPPPSEVLGALVENRNRYLRELDAAIAVTTTLAASRRSEITVASTGLRQALTPLDAVPARIRSLLAALGIDSPDQPFDQILLHLLQTAGPDRLVPALVGLVAALREKAIQVTDALLGPFTETIGAVRQALALLDLGPVLAELQGLYGDVRATLDAVDPATLLADVLASATATLDRLEHFDPLAPVRDVLDAALDTAHDVLDTARPTVVFADVVTMYADLVGLAAGLDVRALLAPVLSALDGLAVQLDDGFDRTGDALQKLQAALPGEVSASSVTGSVDVGVSLG